MGKSLSYILLAIFALLFACNVVNEELDDFMPEELYLNLTDSCSYTIDNIIYSCNNNGTIYPGGTSQINPDLQTGKGYEDSVYFTSGLTLFNWEERAHMKIMFAKKFHKDQLLKNGLNLYYLPVHEKNEFFKINNYPFAIDYERSNTMNGVALSFDTYNEEGYLMTYKTYSPAPWGLETSVMNDAQKDSEFEIIKIHTLMDGRKFVEAKFHAKVFGQYFYESSSGTSEEVKMVTDGYVRFQVRMF